MNDGTGLFNITDCQIVGFIFAVSFGNEFQFDDALSDQTTTLHIYIQYSQINSSRIYVEAKKYYSFMAIIINSCIWSDSDIRKNLEGAIVSVLVENSSFRSITNDTDVGMEFNGVLQFIIRKSFIETNGKTCMFGCAIYVEGTDIVNMYIPSLRTIAETLVCPFGECNFTTSKMLIEDTEITGNIHSTGNVVYSRNINLEMINCTFSISLISVEGGILHHASHHYFQYVKMLNITTNITSVIKPTVVFAVSCGLTEIYNVLILCPQSLHGVKTERASTKLYKCEYSCPKEFYTFDAGYMILNEKYKEGISLKSSNHVSKVYCSPCPVGAYCDNQIYALPNYHGFKTTNRKNITMVRCPDSYCCSDSKNCKTFNSCNTGRTGTLCGTCENNLTESLFFSQMYPP